MTERAFYGSNYERYSEQNEDSTTHKLKNAYWTTKQVVIKKLGRKEDEHVVASDSELDAKLELFRSVQRTCMDMNRILERYQDKICMLSQAENELGRFLKNHGGEDKTRAGKMMAAVGKSLSFSAQQRLALRVPLSRLHQEVETFRSRAIADTLQTVTKMEQKRTDYRAALLWMKNISDNLDPDTFKQLDKFRKVQVQVRTTKSKFDKMKLDSMQKVDLLAASRCNMFSHVLSLYQSTLLQFWEKTCRTMVAVADSFKGYQYYEFSMLKDLTDESRKLADLTKRRDAENSSEKQKRHQSETREQESELLMGSQSQECDDLLLMQHEDEAGQQEQDDFEQLNKKLDEIFTGGDYKDDPDSDIKAAMESNKISAAATANKQDSLGLGLGDTDYENAEEQKERALLEELLKPSDLAGSKYDSIFDDFIGGGGSDNGTSMSECGSTDWSSIFQTAQVNNQKSVGGEAGGSSNDSSLAGLMPSALLDMRSPGQPMGGLEHQMTAAPGTTAAKSRGSKEIDNSSNAAWLSMFADLDPLANPDSISKNEGQITDT